jgi:hypothetical protein
MKTKTKKQEPEIRNSNKKNELNENKKTNAKGLTKLNQNHNYLNLVKNNRQGNTSLARTFSRNGRLV